MSICSQSSVICYVYPVTHDDSFNTEKNQTLKNLNYPSYLMRTREVWGLSLDVVKLHGPPVSHLQGKINADSFGK